MWHLQSVKRFTEWLWNFWKLNINTRLISIESQPNKIVVVVVVVIGVVFVVVIHVVVVVIRVVDPRNMPFKIWLKSGY